MGPAGHRRRGSGRYALNHASVLSLRHRLGERRGDVFGDHPSLALLNEETRASLEVGREDSAVLYVGTREGFAFNAFADSHRNPPCVLSVAAKCSRFRRHQRARAINGWYERLLYRPPG
jgi:hypothetical protein